MYRRARVRVKRNKKRFRSMFSERCTAQSVYRVKALSGLIFFEPRISAVRYLS